MWKALNHSILINESKVMRISCLQVVMDSLIKNELWSPLLNSIFNIFEKKIKTLSVDYYYNIITIGIDTFQFQNKILNFSILNHWLFLSTYYFLPTCCTIPNDLKFFEHVSNLNWNMNPKKNLNHGNFFIHSNMSLWSAFARFFVGPKKGFWLIQMLISCNWCCGNFWKFFHIFLNYCTTRSYGYMYQKIFFFLNFDTCTINGSFGAFLVKT